MTAGMILRVPLVAAAIAALLLAGCKKTPEENVEVQSEKTSRALEERYNQLQAEAENGAEAAAAPYDNEADALLNQMAGNAAAGNLAAANAAGATAPALAGGAPRRRRP
jgi:outer membrane biogenesis lipoprotein LolB